MLPWARYLPGLSLHRLYVPTEQPLVAELASRHLMLRGRTAAASAREERAAGRQGSEKAA